MLMTPRPGLTIKSTACCLSGQTLPPSRFAPLQWGPHLEGSPSPSRLGVSPGGQRREPSVTLAWQTGEKKRGCCYQCCWGVLLERGWLDRGGQ